MRSDADTVTSVRHEQQWPPAATVWARWQLHPDGRLDESAAEGGARSFRTRGRGLAYTHRFKADTEVVGPMRLRLSVELKGGGDVHFFAGIRKLREGRPVAFEGAYGFRGALVTHGMRKASHHVIGTDGGPRDDIAEPLPPRRIVPVDIECYPRRPSSGSARNYNRYKEVRLRRRLSLAVDRQGIQRRMMLPCPSRNLPTPRTTRSTRNQIAVTGAPTTIRVSASIITAVLVWPA